MSFSRRSFLKSSAVAGLALSVNPLLAKDENVKTIPHASNLGAFYADVKDGKIVKIHPQVSDKDPKFPGNEAWNR